MLDLLAIVLSVVVHGGVARPPCYYHQNDAYTYRDEFRPKSGCNAEKCTAAPFVSPDNSLDAHISMIRKSTNNIVIANPNFESWLPDCSRYHSHCDDSKCTGCSLEEAQNETFPILKELLNGVKVRRISVKILTNDYSVPTCKDKVTILDWLHINGADVRMYRTTSFLHAKFMMIDDGKEILISSVNFSERSFTKNRETGVIISDCDCEALRLYKSVFQYDWNIAENHTLTNEYTQKQLKFIKTAPINTPTVDLKPIETFSDTEIVVGYVAPDFARQTFLKLINSTTRSLLVHIYVIGDLDICNQIMSLHNSTIAVSVLVSHNIANVFENKQRQECYNMLSAAGISVVKNNSFPFSHQKYWIVDDRDVHLNTGNWNPSDFLDHYDDKPIPANKYPIYANRNMLIVMRNKNIVRYFKNIFAGDGGKLVN